jgi:hypothetical protein
LAELLYLWLWRFEDGRRHLREKESLEKEKSKVEEIKGQKKYSLCPISLVLFRKSNLLREHHLMYSF